MYWGGELNLIPKPSVGPCGGWQASKEGCGGTPPLPRTPLTPVTSELGHLFKDNHLIKSSNDNESAPY